MSQPWRVTALALAACAVAACADANAGVTTAVTLPEAANPSALASTTLTTSPDGGIYVNPDHLDVLLLTRHDAGDLLRLIPGSAGGWQQLRVLGDFTLIGLLLRNDGKAGSDPRLNALQIASDFAPDGTSSGPLRQYYHPMFPLAVLSEVATDSHCTLHVDPGQRVAAVLVYPPLRQTTSIVWGVYKSFALRVPFGGALPQATYAWRATACVAPQAPAG